MDFISVRHFSFPPSSRLLFHFFSFSLSRANLALLRWVLAKLSRSEIKRVTNSFFRLIFLGSNFLEAAGFTVAILKKLNSKNGSEKGETNSTLQKAEPQMVEVVVLASLEKFFKSVLNMPEVERKFRAVLDAILEAHPHCLQLYLYSTADKFVPYSTVPHPLLSKPQQM
ncbi:hypothetical protein E1A91_A05G386400v1 [Gossypium mustelinum]|uniref:Uncharacterized protein isoform X1 n=3 Tax=Gossypium TaxID=3633 RepID=A0A1U8ISU4_GOSHI|nr:uncharacterized protein LOC107897902 isoform X1 [Gossypium hirsutum]TYJ37594.1 hypothetical protein E1A91_A05G386400v1 [Gossypium mustelinum]